MSSRISLRIGDTNNNKNEDPKLMTMKSHSDAIGLPFCGKCYDFKPSMEMFNTLQCEHKFCKDCIREHVASNLRNNNIINVSCLDSNCKVKYGPENFFSILPFEVFQRWKKVVEDCKTPIWDNKPLLKKQGNHADHEQVKSSPIVLIESDDDDLEDFKIKMKSKKNKKKRNKRGRILY
ncbi:hypothetical protein PIB30_067145 [Stylosanthes scabra]|uniref:RING-type domain-containing protein n=1 Tax=Stylosanthes scabra TaxID=79078 RepID=A0ABU6XM97_9FABA|nr:hypothetical protein [Stylosanthes scabra]